MQKLVPAALVAIVTVGLLVMSDISQARDDGGRWSVKDEGVLIDNFTDMEWTQRDNLTDINWIDAKTYCAELRLDGGGWRLPTMAELSRIFAAGRNDTTACGSYRRRNLTCQVSSKFYLTGPFVWSADVGKRTSEAWDIYLVNGARYSYDISRAGAARALCVRRSDQGRVLYRPE